MIWLLNLGTMTLGTVSVRDSFILDATATIIDSTAENPVKITVEMYNVGSKYTECFEILDPAPSRPNC